MISESVQGGNNLDEMTHALRRGGLLLYSSTSNLYLYRLLKIYMHQILIYNIKYICIKYWYIISSPFKTSFFSCLFHSPFCGVKCLLPCLESCPAVSNATCQDHHSPVTTTGSVTSTSFARRCVDGKLRCI